MTPATVNPAARRYGLCLSALPLGLTALAFLPAAPAGAATPCIDSARQMFVACRYDLHDDLNTARAICTHIADDSERSECLRQSREERQEALELCRAQREARVEACQTLAETRYDPDPLLDPTLDFIDPDDIPALYPPNPYLSLQPGQTQVLRAGDDGEETVVIHVTDAAREILGVACRVVVDAVVLAEADPDHGGTEYLPKEITDDWFAQDIAGDVYYCGEIARNYEDGVLTDLDGSFEAGRDGAKSGVLLRAAPVPGESHRQEFALGEAEDIVQYLALDAAPGADEGGGNPTFPCLPDGCLKTYDSAPLEPESTEYKYYLTGVGFVLAVALEDGEPTGEREELVCSGDSLAVLHSPACGIADPDELLDTLCGLAAEAFCP